MYSSQDTPTVSVSDIFRKIVAEMQILQIVQSCIFIFLVKIYNSGLFCSF